MRASRPTHRPPRLLMIITLAQAGGAQNHVAALLPALTPRFEVAVAAHGPGPLRDAARAAGARFIPLLHVRRAVNPWQDAYGLAEIVRLVRRLRPDIVHAHSSKAGILGRFGSALAGTPVRLFTVHGWAFAQHEGPAGRVYLWADRLAAPLTTAVICVGQQDRALGLRARTCLSDRTVVIPNAVDVHAAPRSELLGAPPTIITVGRFQAPKDPLTLVEALTRLAPGSFRATLVGEGPDRAAVAAAVRQAGLHRTVELTGERHDVAARLAGADVFVLSSRSEGLPLSVLEAMAAGLPVVASAVGDVPEAVADGKSGLLVPPGDPAALAGALGTLLADAGLRRRFGAAARERALELFDLPRFQEAHVRLYGDLLKGCKPRAS